MLRTFLHFCKSRELLPANASQQHAYLLFEKAEGQGFAIPSLRFQRPSRHFGLAILSPLSRNFQQYHGVRSKLLESNASLWKVLVESRRAPRMGRTRFVRRVHKRNWFLIRVNVPSFFLRIHACARARAREKQYLSYLWRGGKARFRQAELSLGLI